MSEADRIRILLIEDDEDDTRLVLDYLHANPDGLYVISIDAVPHLEEGLKRLQGGIYDAIITDLYLPDSRGVATFRRLHHAHSGIPILILSGLDNDEMERLAVQLGAQDYLIKGEFDAESLVRRLVYAIERHRIEDKYRHLFENSSDGIVLFYLDGHIFDVNRRATILFDYEPSDLGQINFLSLLAKREASTGNYFLNAVAEHHFVCQELAFQRRDGREFIAEVSASRLHFSGKPFIQALIRDVTERKRLDEIKHEFIDIVSHELRTPIATLTTAIMNLNEGILGPLTDKQNTVVGIAMKSVGRATGVINRLLELSRLALGTVKPSLQMVSVRGLIDQCILLFAENLKRRGLEVQVPQCEEGLIVNCDANLISQVMNNLVSNAIRHARHLVRLEVQIADENPQIVHFHFSNDGPHLSHEEQERIFDKFVLGGRVDAKPGHHGTGLGLAICKEILKLHNSDIQLMSPADALTRFSFSLKRPPQIAPAGSQ